MIRKLSELLEVSNREHFNDGEVVSIGPDVHEVKRGDRVRYGNGDYLDYDKITIDGQVYQVIREVDVAAVVEA